MENRKEHILEQAGALYFDSGNRKLKMDNVARELGISKKTLYQYFDSKADLITQIFSYYIQEPMFGINRAGNGNAIDRYLAMRPEITNVLKVLYKETGSGHKNLHPDLYRKIQEMKCERIYSVTSENLKSGIKSGLYRKELDIDFVANMQIGSIMFSLNPENGIFSGNGEAIARLYDKVIDYHMHSVCTGKGLKYYQQQLNKTRNEVQN